MNNKKNDKDPKKNLDNPSNYAEGFKKKKRFDDDPIVKKYTETGYKSFKADDSSSKKEEDSSKKKKIFDDSSEIKKPNDYSYQPTFNRKQLDGDDEYKKSKKDVFNILNEMFGNKKDSMPFGNVQYKDHASRIQTGSSGQRSRSSSKKSRSPSRKESPKIEKEVESEGEKEKLASLKVEIRSPAKPKVDANISKKVEETSGSSISPVANFESNKLSGLPDYEKKKKKNLDSDQTSSDNSSSGFKPTMSTQKQEESYERKKKRDYDYETLFAGKPKQEVSPGEKDKIRQAYLTSQTYKTSSRSSLDLENEVISGVSSVLSGIAANSQVESPRTDSAKTDSKNESKMNKKDDSKIHSKSQLGSKADVFTRLKIDENEFQDRVERYKIEKSIYPLDYYKQIRKYFSIKNQDKIEDQEYEILGRLMEKELLNANIIQNTDSKEFLEHLNVSLDDLAKTRRISKFEDQLKKEYKENQSPVENKQVIKSYFDLSEAVKLNESELERLDKIMKKELLARKLEIDTSIKSKEKRANDHLNMKNKLIQNNLNKDDICNYYGLNGSKNTTTQFELGLLADLLKGEVIDHTILQNQFKFMTDNQISDDKQSKEKRFNRFKTDILAKYEIGKVKYFISKYFDKEGEEITDQEMNDLFKLIKTEVELEMANEPEKTKDQLQRVLDLMNNEIKIMKEQKEQDRSSFRAYSLPLDKNAIKERLKRFNDVILPDYQSGLKKLNYKDRIAVYFNTNLDAYTPNNIEVLGRLMSTELKENNVDFIDTDHQYLEDKKIGLDENSRNKRIKKYNPLEEKLKEDEKKLSYKNLIKKYFDFDPEYLNEDLVNFSDSMMDELTSEPKEELSEQTKLTLQKKGVDISIDSIKKRRLRFKTEILPEYRLIAKNLVGYNNLVVQKYFSLENVENLEKQEIARLKRLMDKEIRQGSKAALCDKYKISLDKSAIRERLEKFKDVIEPDYKNKLNKLNYRDRILTYFNLKASKLEKEDLEKLGKLMEDELADNREQFPTDDDLYLNDLGIPFRYCDKKKRILKLKDELERNPIQNPLQLLKVYFSLAKTPSRDSLKRLVKIMENEQIGLNGELVTNQLRNKTDYEKLIANLNLLQLHEPDSLGSKINKGKNLNEEVLRLGQENVNKINEMKALLEQKIKNRQQQDDPMIEKLKKELDDELKQQDDLELEIKTSNIDDVDQQKTLLEKLEEQNRHLKEKRDQDLREEAEKLRKENEENYKKRLENLEEEEKQKELRAIESLERAKKQMIEKHREEHSLRKQQLQAEAEKASFEIQRKLDQHAKESDEEVRKKLEDEKKKLDEEYQKIKENKEMTKKLKKDFEEERSRIEKNVLLIEQKMKDARLASEEQRKAQLDNKVKELEEQNSKKLNEEAARLEKEAAEQIKKISENLEEEINKSEKADAEEEMNKVRSEKVAAINELNRKKLDEMAKSLEQKAVEVLDQLSKELDESARKNLEKLIEESRKEHESQIAKLKDALNNLTKNGKNGNGKKII